MKYYCKNCGTIYDLKKSAYGESYYDPDDMCPICGNTDPDYDLIPIPDWETPEQYEKRTGKPYPDDGLVWWRHIVAAGPEPVWLVARLSEAVKEAGIASGYSNVAVQIVIADPPIPPPDDWKPEGGVL